MSDRKPCWVVRFDKGKESYFLAFYSVAEMEIAKAKARAIGYETKTVSSYQNGMIYLRS